MAFFQAGWDVIKADIMGVFHDFHACKFEKSLNATIIVGLLILRTFGLLVLWVEFIRLLPKSLPID
jgi:hypothetical protein